MRNKRNAQQYLGMCINVNPSSLIQIEFLRFQPGLSGTGHVVQIFFGVQDHIAEVLNSAGSDFGLKIYFFQSPSLTMKESVFRIINRRITIDAI